MFNADKGEEEKLFGQWLVEINSGGFVSAMRALARHLASLKGRITIDDLRKWAKERDVYPHHPNAWGAVFKTGFKAVGRVKSKLVSNHRRWVFVWEIDRGQPSILEEPDDDWAPI
jgi:hypothetical protein